MRRALLALLLAGLLMAPTAFGQARDPRPAPTPATTASATPTPPASAPAPDTLSLRSPLCDPARRVRLAPAQRRACERSGSPAADQPTSHYAFDLHWDPALTNPTEVVTKSFYGLLNMLWLALLYALRGLLALLDWAFSLNPFEAALPGANSPLGSIDAGLERFFSVIDAGWFSVVIVSLGLWGMWAGIVRREAGRAAGGLALGAAMLALCLLVLHRPGETIGEAARLANDAAVGLLVAPTRGIQSDPVSSYGDAMAQTFDSLVRRPWCALNFDSQAFCDGAPEPKARLAAVTADRQRTAAVTARTRAEMWLAYPPGGEARKVLHEFYAGKDGGEVGAFGVTIVDVPGIGDQDGENPEAVAIQGPAGGLTRLPLLLLVVAGVLGAALLLGWLALRLLMQATLGFVLLLAAPVAFLFPALGELGRAAFTKWGLTLLGAIVSKVIYAALLGVVLLAASILTGNVADASWMLGWLLLTAFWWTLFLKRDEVLAILSVVPGAGDRRGGHRHRRLIRAAGEAAGDARKLVIRERLMHRQATTEAVRDASRERLAERAEHRQATLQSHAPYVAGAGGPSIEQLAESAGQPQDLDPDRRGSPREPARLAPAASDVAHTSAETASRARPPVDELRAELDRPDDDPVHAWRVGRTPEQLSELAASDPKQHAALRARIATELAAERAMNRAADKPRRSAPDPLTERAARAQLNDERVTELRRERHAQLRHERALRRYVSR